MMRKRHERSPDLHLLGVTTAFQVSFGSRGTTFMVQERPPQFQVRRDQGCTIITASGPEIEFDSKDELYAHAEAGELEPRQVVLNLSHVVNYKSAILGILIQFQRKVQKAGGRLKVGCPD